MREISKELKFIKGFSSTSVNRICKEYKINRGNLISNKVSRDKEKLVYNRLVKELSEMIVEISNHELTKEQTNE